MALRDKLRSRSQPFLEPGEQIRHIWMGQSGVTPYLVIVVVVAAVAGGAVLRGGLLLAAAFGAVLGGLLAMLMQPQLVCVTDRAVVVLRSSRWMPSAPKQVLNRLPRQTVFGVLHGLWGQTRATGEKLYVHARFHKDVAAADAELAAYQTHPGHAAQLPTPPGWYPDPQQPGRQRWYDGANWTAHTS